MSAAGQRHRELFAFVPGDRENATWVDTIESTSQGLQRDLANYEGCVAGGEGKNKHQT